MNWIAAHQPLLIAAMLIAIAVLIAALVVVFICLRFFRERVTDCEKTATTHYDLLTYVYEFMARHLAADYIENAVSQGLHERYQLSVVRYADHDGFRIVVEKGTTELLCILVDVSLGYYRIFKDGRLTSGGLGSGGPLKEFPGIAVTYMQREPIKRAASAFAG